MGKNGLTPEFIEQVKRLFEDVELIKVQILKSACRDKKEAKDIAEKLADALGKNYAYRLVGYVVTLNKFRRNVRE